MHCIQDNAKQNRTTAELKKNVIQRLSEKKIFHLNNIKTENSISDTVLLLTLNNVSLNMFIK